VIGDGPKERFPACRAMPPCRPTSANDNRRNVPLLRRFAWGIDRTAAQARWIGRVIASTAGEAIEAAAVDLDTDAWKLIAVRRFEIAKA
jgi:hypothetical protein